MNFNNPDYKNRSEKREIRKKLVLEYVRKEIQNGNYPSYKKLLKKFNIGFWRINLKDIYPKLGVDFLHVPFKRPNSCRKELRKELLKYVRNEVKKRHYPSLRIIQSKFNLNLTPYLFKSTKELYNKAGLKYKQKNSYEIMSRKAEILSDIAISILPQLNLSLVKERKVCENGVDILAKDEQDNPVGIELKALNKNEVIKERNFNQLERFTKKEHLHRIILVTTTNRIANKYSKIKDLTIIDYDRLKKLVNKKQLKALEYIRNQSIHVDTGERERKKKILIDYVQKLNREGKEYNIDIIRKNTGLYPNTYFGSVFILYKVANVPASSYKSKEYKNDEKQKRHETIINEVLNFIKEEISKGNIPTAKDIVRKFHISLNKYTTMTELYHVLGLPAYHERKERVKKLRSMRF